MSVSKSRVPDLQISGARSRAQRPLSLHRRESCHRARIQQSKSSLWMRLLRVARCSWGELNRFVRLVSRLASREGAGGRGLSLGAGAVVRGLVAARSRSQRHSSRGTVRTRTRTVAVALQRPWAAPAVLKPRRGFPATRRLAGSCRDVRTGRDPVVKNLACSDGECARGVGWTP